MNANHPLLSVRVSQETFLAVRQFAASRPDMTFREIMEAAIEQYLSGCLASNERGGEHPIRLRPGRRKKLPLLEDAVVILDDGDGTELEPTSDGRLAQKISA